jgi:hypothetical protein
MVVLLTAIDEQGQIRDFSCQLSDLETGFDLLSYVAILGHTLLKVRLVDGDNLINLPTEAFDQNPISPVIRELEKEWRHVLSQPLDLNSIFNQPIHDHSLAGLPSTMEHCLVYFSRSCGLFQEEDLAAILQQSRQHNAQVGITGVLLYVRGSIIQVLEGEKEAVEALYKRIERDRRHRDVTCVLRRSIDSRLFASWSMGYETLSVQELDEIKTIVALDKHEDSSSKGEESIILKTLKVFYESNRYN